VAGAIATWPNGRHSKCKPVLLASWTRL